MVDHYSSNRRLDLLGFKPESLVGESVDYLLNEYIK